MKVIYSHPPPTAKDINMAKLMDIFKVGILLSSCHAPANQAPDTIHPRGIRAIRLLRDNLPRPPLLPPLCLVHPAARPHAVAQHTDARSMAYGAGCSGEVDCAVVGAHTTPSAEKRRG